MYFSRATWVGEIHDGRPYVQHSAPLNAMEALETSMINPLRDCWGQRHSIHTPCEPHHTASMAAIVGE